MSYIGKTPTVGNFIKLDDISTSSTNSYTLQHNSVNFSPESANHMLVSLNGVIQAPNSSFSVSGSTITFLPSSGTLSSSDSIDFIMVYGNVLDVGVASSVADASITKGKMNLISDSSSAGLTIKGDGGSENGTLQLNCSQNSHGVKLSSPAHSSGQSYELILPTGNVTADKFLKVASVSGSGATGVGQLSFADAGGSNAPYFHVKGSKTLTGDNVTQKLDLDTTVVDSASLLDASNDKLVIASAGKYFISYGIGGTISNFADELQTFRGYLYKNGSSFYQAKHSDSGSNPGEANYVSASFVMDLSANDYLELYALSDVTGSHYADCYEHLTGFKIIE